MNVTLKVMMEHWEKAKAFSLPHHARRAIALAIALRVTPPGLLDFTR